MKLEFEKFQALIEEKYPRRIQPDSSVSVSILDPRYKVVLKEALRVTVWTRNLECEYGKA